MFNKAAETPQNPGKCWYRDCHEPKADDYDLCAKHRDQERTLIARERQAEAARLNNEWGVQNFPLRPAEALERLTKLLRQLPPDANVRQVTLEFRHSSFIINADAQYLHDGRTRHKTEMTAVQAANEYLKEQSQ